MTQNHSNLKCLVKGSISLSAAGPKAPSIRISFYTTGYTSIFSIFAYEGFYSLFYILSSFAYFFYPFCLFGGGCAF